jgi:hypothetical protein
LKERPPCCRAVFPFVKGVETIGYVSTVDIFDSADTRCDPTRLQMCESELIDVFLGMRGARSDRILWYRANHIAGITIILAMIFCVVI